MINYNTCLKHLLPAQSCNKFLLILLLLPFQILATTRSVCSSGCDFSTIQEAINNSIAGDVISIKDAIHTEANVTISVNGLIFEGISETGTIIQAANAPQSSSGRIFTLNDNLETTIRNMTLRYGSTTFRGGAILIGDATTLNMSKVTLTENYADVDGGAISTDSGTSDCIISISDCTFSDNVAHNAVDLDAYGGGIYNGGGDLTLTDCVFSNNRCDEEGGGVYISEYLSKNEFYRCNFNDNRSEAVGTISFGGGISVIGGNIYLEDCIIEDNFASNGGGLSLFDPDFEHFFELNNCIIRGNIADQPDGDADGGGILIENGLSYLYKCSIIRNSAGDDGGGLAFLSSGFTPHTVENCTIGANEAGKAGPSQLENRRGGGADITGKDDVWFINCTIANNKTLTSADNVGGGVYVSSDAIIAMTNNIFTNNEAAGGLDLYLQTGACLCLNETNLVENCEVNNGTCPTFTSTSDPLLGGLSTCNSGAAYKYTLFESAPANDVGTISMDTPAEDICGDTRGTLMDLGSVEAITCGNISFNGDLTIQSQSDLDVLDPCMFTVTGQILIIGDDITDISNLGKLNTVARSVIIRETSLTSLEGLESFQNTTNFIVANNPKLTTLNGLSNLTNAKNIVITNNPLLTEYGNAIGLGSNGGVFRIIDSPLP
ncbi:MAG: right-handed parallel beta-helix repeat-containing protein [Bacteroidota bacterium]